MSAPFQIEPLPASFGATVTGLALAGLDDAAFAALYATWLTHGLLIFPGQHLRREDQVAFARRFGALEIEITPISNVRADGSVRHEAGDDVVKVLKGNMGWHCDSTYMPVQAKGAVFTAHIVPDDGGETDWADMAAAYDALAPALRERIAGLSARHSLRYSQGKLGHTHTGGSPYSGYGMSVEDPPLRRLVKRHPETGRACLMVGRHAYGIPGLTPEASEALLDELTALACRPPRTWRHRWSPGDAVIWDNRRLMHRACPWDMTVPRVMYHSRIAGDPVSEFAATG
ncbi:TauD/TfdA family dioxygenase [Phenylobacterium sp.]|uniref:TauD/TfdA dioxygenase family protein n=1 Tax=Phenylobacterium sp. TaxID=1871053 RepID=UPI0025FA30F6|nr:TauD/TfdA family dioxygenase [Phenylobacterium sp.]